MQAIAATEDKRAQSRVGRYEIFDRIASGGMATVHLARLSGAEGFSRVVAVKRMHPHFLVDPAFKAMFIAEARVAARVRHPNVVPILDVLAENDEIVIVMDYVHGESLMALTRAGRKAEMPVDVATSIMVGMLQGLHAAHSASDEKGRPLGLVHRDVSPHNVLLGSDGVARVLDFGIAKVLQGHGDTDPGVLKGKFSYIAPELIQGDAPSRQSDLFSAAVVFWELLTGKKLFTGVNDQERLLRIVKGDYPTVRSVRPHVPELVDRIVMRGLRVQPALRHDSALAMAVELESATPLASQRVVGEWVTKLVGDVLAQRSELIHHIEASSISMVRRSVPPLAVAASPELAAVTGGTSMPAPSVSRVRATAPKSRILAFVVAGAVVAAAALLGAFIALRSPPQAKPALAAVSPVTAVTAPPVAVPEQPAAVPAPPLPAPDTSAASAPTALAPPAAPSHRTLGTPTPPVKSGSHAAAKRPRGSYLPNEL